MNSSGRTWMIFGERRYTTTGGRDLLLGFAILEEPGLIARGEGLGPCKAWLDDDLIGEYFMFALIIFLPLFFFLGLLFLLIIFGNIVKVLPF